MENLPIWYHFTFLSQNLLGTCLWGLFLTVTCISRMFFLKEKTPWPVTGDDRQIFPSVASQQDLTQNPRMSGAEVLGFTHYPCVLLKSAYLFLCGTTKNACIYKYIICAHMYVYEYIMLNNRKQPCWHNRNEECLKQERELVWRIWCQCDVLECQRW